MRSANQWSLIHGYIQPRPEWRSSGLAHWRTQHWVAQIRLPEEGFPEETGKPAFTVEALAYFVSSPGT
jgi:hypothetical protein